MVSVEGTIIEARPQRNGSVVLNFSTEKHTFCALIPESGLALFPSRPADLYVGKKVRVIGRIMTYEDRPQIRIDSPDQIIKDDAISIP
jgi:RecJ-like exonuclease